jgi:hypothetical protein
MSSDVYTPSAVQAFIFSSNIRALITTFFGLFSIFRYSDRFMESGYRFHLLNMAVWILICDLTILVLWRPYPLLPLNGGCFVGEVNGFLLSHIQVETASYVIIVSIYKLKCKMFIIMFFSCLADSL